jgi:hypothetical protein
LSFYTFSFGHCVVYSSSIYEFWLPLWYLQTLLLCLMIWCYCLFCWYCYKPGDKSWTKKCHMTLWKECLHNDGQQNKLSPLTSNQKTTTYVLLYLFLLATVLSVLLRYTDSDCPFGIFQLFLWLLDSMWSFWVESNLCKFCIVYWYLCYRWRSNYQQGNATLLVFMGDQNK